MWLYGKYPFEKDLFIWIWKCTTLHYVHLRLYPYCTNSFYKSSYISIYTYHYALLVNSFYQLNNVLFKNKEQTEAPSLPTCFVRLYIYIVLQPWSTWDEVSVRVATRRGYDWQRRSEHWWVLQQPAGGLRWRSKGHDEIRVWRTYYSCGRTDCGLTGQWAWDAANPLCPDVICIHFAAGCKKGIPKHSITAGLGVIWSDVRPRYFPNNNLESQRFWKGLL